jgi:hypothetical protein
MEVSLIFKTILFLLVSAVIYRIVLYLMHVRRITAIFKGAKGPEKCHWLFGSLVHVSYVRLYLPSFCSQGRMKVDLVLYKQGEQRFLRLATSNVLLSEFKILIDH